MRIFIASIEEPLYCPLFLKDIIEEFRDDIVGISILSPFQKKTISKGISETPAGIIKSRIKYYGVIDFIKQSYFFVLYKILDKIPYRLLTKRRFYSVRRLAKYYGLDMVFCPSSNVNDADYIDRLRVLNIDIIICLLPQIVKSEFLRSARIGCLNTHCGFLPKNRGREPIFWAMVNQERFAGVTVHFMNEKADSGPILKQQKIAIDANDTLHNLYLKAIKLGSRLMIEGIKDLEKGKRDFIYNDDNFASYNDWPDKEAVGRFRRLGMRFR